MNENYFSKKMSSKSNEDLSSMILDTKNYVEDARKAATWELKRRNEQIPETPVLNINPEIIDHHSESIQAESELNFLNIEEDDMLDSININLPKLYSKGVIVIFSILFSTLFGSILYAMNLYALKKKEKMYAAIFFGLVFTILIITIIEYIPQVGRLSILLNLGGGYILTEGLWNAQIGKKIAIRKRDWSAPFIISFLLACGLITLTIYSGG